MVIAEDDLGTDALRRLGELEAVLVACRERADAEQVGLDALDLLDEFLLAYRAAVADGEFELRHGSR